MSADAFRGERGRDDQQRTRDRERRAARSTSAHGGEPDEGDLAVEGAGLFGRYRPRSEREARRHS